VARQNDFWTEANTQFRQKLVEFGGYRLFLLLKRDETDGYAQDIVNETFLAAHERFPTFDPQRGKLQAWLRGIAFHKMLEFLRSHKELLSERFMEDVDLEKAAASRDAEFLYDRAARPNPRTAALRKAMKRLARYDRTLLMCRLGNRMSYDEIERYFNFTVKKATLRVHIHRAEARLRKELARWPEFAELMEKRYEEGEGDA